MARVIRVHQYGSLDTLRLEEIAPVAPNARQLRIRQMVIGVKFIDSYERSGLYL